SERRPPVLTLVQFGFDRERLYVRVDAARRVVDLLAEGYELSLKFVQPRGIRFSVRHTLGRLTGRFWDRLSDPPRQEPGAEPRWFERGPGGAVVAAGTILETALPLADLGVATGDAVAFFV